MKIGLQELAVSAAKAAGKTVMRMFNGEEVIVDSDMHHARLMICNECNHFTGSRCEKCGCNTRIKTKLKGESCPEAKW